MVIDNILEENKPTKTNEPNLHFYVKTITSQYKKLIFNLFNLFNLNKLNIIK